MFYFCFHFFKLLDNNRGVSDALAGLKSHLIDFCSSDSNQTTCKFPMGSWRLWFLRFLPCSPDQLWLSLFLCEPVTVLKGTRGGWATIATKKCCFSLQCSPVFLYSVILPSGVQEVAYRNFQSVQSHWSLELCPEPCLCI